jgi:hypothetical protein
MSLFGYGFGFASRAGSGSSGLPDAAKLIFRWSGTSPLLSLDGNGYTFTHSGSVETRNGRDAVVLTAGDTIQNAVADSLALGNLADDRITVYALSKGVRNGPNVSVLHVIFKDGGSNRSISLLEHTSASPLIQAGYNNGPDNLFNLLSPAPTSDDVPYVSNNEWTGDTSGDLLASANKTRNGSSTSAGTPGAGVSPSNFSVNTNGSQPVTERVLWEVLVYRDAPWNPDTVDWLRSLVGLPPA